MFIRPDDISWQQKLNHVQLQSSVFLFFLFQRAARLLYQAIIDGLIMLNFKSGLDLKPESLDLNSADHQ